MDISGMAAVLRIDATSMTREALEAALGTALERYEPSRHAETSYYAQVDIPAEYDTWNALTRWTETIGPKLSTLRKNRLVGATSIDLAVTFAEGKANLSLVVPSYVATTVGGYGIDIEFSVYLVTEEIGDQY